MKEVERTSILSPVLTPGPFMLQNLPSSGMARYITHFLNCLLSLFFFSLGVVDGLRGVFVRVFSIFFCLFLFPQTVRSGDCLVVPWDPASIFDIAHASLSSHSSFSIFILCIVIPVRKDTIVF